MGKWLKQISDTWKLFPYFSHTHWFQRGGVEAGFKLPLLCKERQNSSLESIATNASQKPHPPIRCVQEDTLLKVKLIFWTWLLAGLFLPWQHGFKNKSKLLHTFDFDGEPMLSQVVAVKHRCTPDLWYHWDRWAHRFNKPDIFNQCYVTL